MLLLKNLNIQEITLLEVELFIAKLRKWMICLAVGLGALFIQFKAISPAQGLIAAAAVLYSFQVESYYRSTGVRGFKYLSALVDFAVLWGTLYFWGDFEYRYLGLFFINAVLLSMRFAIFAWPWLLGNTCLFVLALHQGGNLVMPPLEVVWLLVISGLSSWMAEEHRQMDTKLLSLYRMNQLSNSTLRESDVLEITSREMGTVGPGSYCYVAKLNSREEFIILNSPRRDLLGKLELGSAITNQLVKEQQPVVIKNTLQEKRIANDFLKKFYLKSVLLAPVVVQGRTTGLMILESHKIRDFNHDELAMVMLAASQIGISLENARLYEQTESLARMDELTKIYNRRAFQELFEAQLAQVQHKKNSLSLVILDIDFFKKINDRWGHQVGDYVLKRVADLMQQNLRDVDSIARYGGEEFVISLPGAGKRAALRVAERIRQTVESGEWLENISVTLSAGVASYPEDGKSLEELMKKADLALYSAKASGRNLVRTYSNSK